MAFVTKTAKTSNNRQPHLSSPGERFWRVELAEGDEALRNSSIKKARTKVGD